MTTERPASPDKQSWRGPGDFRDDPPDTGGVDLLHERSSGHAVRHPTSTVNIHESVASHWPGMTDSCLIDDFGPLPVASPRFRRGARRLRPRRRRRRTRPSIPSAAAPCSVYGLPPTKPGVAVSTARLDQVIDYPARDMTITVQAGITLARLDDLLAAENQRLPIDVPQRRAGHARRGAGGQRQRAAALRARHPARLRHRHQRRQRRGPGGQGRRARRQERGRLRPVQALRRLAGHAGHHQPGDAQAEAAARGAGPADPRLRRLTRLARCSTRCTARAPGRSAWSCSTRRRPG